MIRSASRALSAALLAGLALTSGARADIVTLNDGRVLEGSVTVSGTSVVVRQRLGEVRVRMEQVLRIVETVDPWDDLERLRKELAAGTADERYRFAVFCRDNDFQDEARRAFLDVLRVDTDHPGARAALGFVRHDGRWITGEDRNRALGLVEHEGEWLTPDERARRVERARETAEARRAAKDAELADARAKRAAERAEERAARRERALAFDRALARAEAQERALDSYDDRRLSSGIYVPGVFGGRCRVITTPWAGMYRPPCPVPGRGSSYGSRIGSSVGGSYRSGKWSLNFRFGF